RIIRSGDSGGMRGIVRYQLSGCPGGRPLVLHTIDTVIDMSESKPLDGFATSPEWNVYEGGIAVWPVGAFEQHGRHLPLMTDNLLATYFGRRLAADLDAVLLPTLPFGTSLEQAGFRGSITLTPEILMALVRQMADELEAQNFTRLVILSGHGGNFSLYPA